MKLIATVLLSVLAFSFPAFAQDDSHPSLPPHFAQNLQVDDTLDFYATLNGGLVISGTDISETVAHISIKNGEIFLWGARIRPLTTSELIGIQNHYRTVANDENTMNCSGSNVTAKWSLIQNGVVTASQILQHDSCGGLFAKDERGRRCPIGTYFGKNHTCLHGFTPPYTVSPLGILENMNIWRISREHAVTVIGTDNERMLAPY